MPHRPILRLCLEPTLLESAEAGEHNYIKLIAETAKNALFRVEYSPLGAGELFKPAGPDVYTLSHMRQPPSGRGLIFRRVYYYPFWQIDQTSERWAWDTAKAHFDPVQVPAEEARKFAGFWRKRLFGQAALETRQDGYVYVPLQGKIRAHRSFQSCSPIEMLQHTLAWCGARRVVATLHPKEEYSTVELAALDKLKNRYSQLTIATGEMAHHLQHCDYVVTQNSSAAFAGYFFGKAALLFAGIDFHHIAVRADMNDLAGSFAAVADARPDVDLYLWWFLQSQSINAGKSDAQDKIAARLRRFGWPI